MLLRLDDQVVDMNKNLMKKIGNLTNELSAIRELSNQSDYLFNEVLKVTQIDSSNNESLNISKLTINNDDESEFNY